MWVPWFRWVVVTCPRDHLIRVDKIEERRTTFSNLCGRQFSDPSQKGNLGSLDWYLMQENQDFCCPWRSGI
jgi:hypothetical protein